MHFWREILFKWITTQVMTSILIWLFRYELWSWSQNSSWWQPESRRRRQDQPGTEERTFLKKNATEVYVAPRLFSPTFIYFYPLSSTFIYFHQLTSTLIYVHPFSSTFIQFHPHSSTFIHFHSLSSIFIHFHPLLSTYSHPHPLYQFSLTFIHFHHGENNVNIVASTSENVTE